MIYTMLDNPQERIGFESSFDINRLSFDNVSKEFENKFRKAYANSLESMSDNKNPLTNASGANTLGILEKMAQHISDYDRNSRFDDSYKAMLNEFESYTET